MAMARGGSRLSRAHVEERDDVTPRAVASALQDVYAAAAPTIAVSSPAIAQRPIEHDRRDGTGLDDPPDLGEITATGRPQRGGEPRDLLASAHVFSGGARNENSTLVEQLRQRSRVAQHECVLELHRELLGSARCGRLALHLNPPPVGGVDGPKLVRWPRLSLPEIWGSERFMRGVRSARELVRKGARQRADRGTRNSGA